MQNLINQKSKHQIQFTDICFWIDFILCRQHLGRTHEHAVIGRSRDFFTPRNILIEDWIPIRVII